jgi:hypothetical protein
MVTLEIWSAVLRMGQLSAYDKPSPGRKLCHARWNLNVEFGGIPLTRERRVATPRCRPEVLAGTKFSTLISRYGSFATFFILTSEFFKVIVMVESRPPGMSQNHSHCESQNTAKGGSRRPMYSGTVDSN